MARLLAAVFPRTTVVASSRKAFPLVSARALCEHGGRFAVGVTLRNAARAKILISCAADWTTGSHGEGARILLTAPRRVDRSRHQVHDADSILNAFGLEAADPSWRPSLPLALKEEGAAALARMGVDHERGIGLAPTTAGSETKRWPIRYYGELAARLRVHSCRPIVLIGPGEEAIAEELCSVAGHDVAVAGADRDVAGLAALVAGLRTVVGNDSGAVQVAATFGTPVVAIFGPSESGRTGPLGAGHRVLARKAGSGGGISGISVEEVETAIFEMLRHREDISYD
jgi:ADP-heptose:LPS heptosyltransferase